MPLTGRAILGVPEEADGDLVRAAYRRISKLVHPDVNESPGATEMMRVINLAFEEASKTPPRPSVRPQAGSSLRDPCSEVITFGKYKGQTVGSVLREAPWYALWILENFKTDKWLVTFKAAIDHVHQHRHGWTKEDAIDLEEAGL